MSAAAAVPGAEPADVSSGRVATPESALPENLRWSVVKNTVSQIVGRVTIALARLLVARLIVRGLGNEVFGAYSLIIVLLSISEWLLDFGTSDFFVREICREPERRLRLLRIMTTMKLAQTPLAFLWLAATVFAFRYPIAIVKASLIGGMSLVFYAGVLAYRVVFRESLIIERDVAAELLSVISMIGFTALAAKWGAGLTAVFLCYVLSRIVYLAGCLMLGKGRFVPSTGGTGWVDVRWCVRSSWAIGLVGLLVVVYESIDVVLLSRFGSLSQVASYSAAQRFIFPLSMCLSAVAATLYTIVARYWPRSRPQFYDACQKGIDVSVVLTGLAVCAMLASAEFLLALIGSGLVAAAPVLRVLGFILFAKAVSMTLGPVLYVVNAQKHVLKIVISAMILKIILIATLAPLFGALGVAYGTLSADVLAAGLSIYLVRRFASFHMSWPIVSKALIITVAASSTTRMGHLGGARGAFAAVILYVSLTFVSGCIRMSDVSSLLRQRAT